MYHKRVLEFLWRKKLVILTVLTVLIFFWPIFRGYIPFPGDNLVGFYEPYRGYPILDFPPGGVPNKAQGADVIRELFPWKVFTIESFKSGHIPFWNPYNFSGNPLMANFQSGIFYPINAIFLILPFNLSWTIFILLIPLLSTYFTYLFLRELNLSKTSSFFGGIVFSFSSYMVVWMQYGNIGHTLLWLPLVLFFIEKLIKKFNYKYLLLLVLIFCLSILAGYIQGYFYSVVMAFAYFIFKGFLKKKLNIRRIVYFSISLIFPIVLASFQILPTLELFKESSRSDYSLTQIQNMLNPWWYSITAIAPNFFGNPAAQNHWYKGTYIESVSYIGLIPFTLFLHALASFKRKKETIFFALIGLFCFFICIDLFITKYFFRIPIPVLSTAVPTRILSLYQFCASILAAFGIEYLLKNYSKKRLYLSIAFVACLIIMAWIFVLFLGTEFKITSSSLAIAKRNLVIPTLVILLFSASAYLWIRFKSKFIIGGILLLTLIDLFYFFHKITPFSPQEFVYPKTPVVEYLKKNSSIDRFWGYGSGYIDSNFQTFDKTFSPEGNDPLHIKSYTELVSSSKNGIIPTQLPRPDANIFPGYGENDLRENQFRQRILNLLGVKYVIHKKEESFPDTTTFPVDIYNFIYHDRYFQIYENKQALPRFFLTGEYDVVVDRKEELAKLYETSRSLKKLTLSKKPKLNIVSDSKSSSELVLYKPNKILIKTKSKENNLLFISDTYYPEWRAKIDGDPSEILIANYTFRAIEVPAGSHSVEFYYYPRSFQLGILISLAGLMSLIPFIMYVKKNEE